MSLPGLLPNKEVDPYSSPTSSVPSLSPPESLEPRLHNEDDSTRPFVSKAHNTRSLPDSANREAENVDPADAVDIEIARLRHGRTSRIAKMLSGRQENQKATDNSERRRRLFSSHRRRENSDSQSQQSVSRLSRWRGKQMTTSDSAGRTSGSSHCELSPGAAVTSSSVMKSKSVSLNIFSEKGNFDAKCCICDHAEAADSVSNDVSMQGEADSRCGTVCETPPSEAAQKRTQRIVHFSSNDCVIYCSRSIENGIPLAVVRREWVHADSFDESSTSGSVELVECKEDVSECPQLAKGQAISNHCDEESCCPAEHFTKAAASCVDSPPVVKDSDAELAPSPTGSDCREKSRSSDASEVAPNSSPCASPVLIRQDSLSLYTKSEDKRNAEESGSRTRFSRLRGWAGKKRFMVSGSAVTDMRGVSSVVEYFKGSWGDDDNPPNGRHTKEKSSGHSLFSRNTPQRGHLTMMLQECEAIGADDEESEEDEEDDDEKFDFLRREEGEENCAPGGEDHKGTCLPDERPPFVRASTGCAQAVDRESGDGHRRSSLPNRASAAPCPPSSLKSPNAVKKKTAFNVDTTTSVGRGISCRLESSFSVSSTSRKSSAWCCSLNPSSPISDSHSNSDFVDSRQRSASCHMERNTTVSEKQTSRHPHRPALLRSSTLAPHRHFSRASKSCMEELRAASRSFGGAGCLSTCSSDSKPSQQTQQTEECSSSLSQKQHHRMRHPSSQSAHTVTAPQAPAFGGLTSSVATRGSECISSQCSHCPLSAEPAQGDAHVPTQHNDEMQKVSDTHRRSIIHRGLQTSGTVSPFFPNATSSNSHGQQTRQSHPVRTPMRRAHTQLPAAPFRRIPDSCVAATPCPPGANSPSRAAKCLTLSTSSDKSDGYRQRSFSSPLAPPFPVPKSSAAPSVTSPRSAQFSAAKPRPRLMYNQAGPSQHTTSAHDNRTTGASSQWILPAVDAVNAKLPAATIRSAISKAGPAPESPQSAPPHLDILQLSTSSGASAAPHTPTSRRSNFSPGNLSFRSRTVPTKSRLNAWAKAEAVADSRCNSTVSKRFAPGLVHSSAAAVDDFSRSISRRSSAKQSQASPPCPQFRRSLTVFGDHSHRSSIFGSSVI